MPSRPSSSSTSRSIFWSAPIVLGVCLIGFLSWNFLSFYQWSSESVVSSSPSAFAKNHNVNDNKMEWSNYLARGVPPSKRLFIGGNWKCNGNVAETKKIVAMLNSAGQIPIANEVVVAVPSLQFGYCLENFRSDISVASQNIAVHNKYGAFTGEISGEMLKDYGVHWAIVGHSERRQGFGMVGESNELVGAKVAAGLAAGVKVIACIGEKLDEREANITMQVCAAQLASIKEHVKKIEDWKNIVIAYEPVWAIGTGKVATPQQAQETHKQIRDWMAEHVSAEVAQQVRIVYGGSVKANNCNALINCPDIDGFLVGGASLLPEFIDIMKVVKN